MQADKKILDVSSSSLAQLRQEYSIAHEAIAVQLHNFLSSSISDLFFECLVVGSDEKRRCCTNLTLEPRPKSQSSISHLREILGGVISSGVTTIANKACDKLKQLATIQLDYCCDVFAPNLTNVHRYVVDGELKDIFHQLRLFRQLETQEGNFLDELGHVMDYAKPTSQPSPMRSQTAAQRSDATKASSSGSPALSSLSGLTAVELTQALKQSFAREKLLHAKLDATHHALLERAAKEQESVDNIKRKMEEQQQAATVEMQQQLTSFRTELAGYKQQNEELQMRLRKTCDVAYVLDELCGKLNCHIAALKCLMAKEGFASRELSRLDEALQTIRTTSCCRGKPLYADGGWAYGEFPDTAGWMKELSIGADLVPTVECCSSQHHLLQEVIDVVAIEAENKLLKAELAKSRLVCQSRESQRIRQVSEAKQNAATRVNDTEQRVVELIEENNKLRRAMAQLLDSKSGGVPLSSRGQSHGSQLTDAEYLEHVRCKAELRNLQAKVMMCERQHPVATTQPCGSNSGEGVAFAESLPTASEEKRISASFSPQLTAALRVVRPSSARPSSARRFARPATLSVGGTSSVPCSPRR